MTGRALKAQIFRYLESRGWRRARPGEYYAWLEPGDTRRHYYCWHAALLVEMAREEHATMSLPVGAFVIEGEGRVVP